MFAERDQPIRCARPAGSRTVFVRDVCLRPSWMAPPGRARVTLNLIGRYRCCARGRCRRADTQPTPRPLSRNLRGGVRSLNGRYAGSGSLRALRYFGASPPCIGKWAVAADSVRDRRPNRRHRYPYGRLIVAALRSRSAPPWRGRFRSGRVGWPRARLTTHVVCLHGTVATAPFELVWRVVSACGLLPTTA